jgi:hypothetical protein
VAVFGNVTSQEMDVQDSGTDEQDSRTDVPEVGEEKE